MQHLGKVQEKEIHLTATVEELAAFPHQHYLALILADQYKTKAHGAVLQHIIAKEPLFVYCCSTNFQDMEDDAVELLCEKYPGFDDDTVMPMTFAGNDLEEALKFCVHDAFHEEKEIDHILIIDLKENATAAGEIKKMLENIDQR